MIDSASSGQPPSAPEPTHRPEGKADFSDIYNDVDALAYYPTLGALDYEIPQRGVEVFNRLLDVHPRIGADAGTVLDLCCSYGVGGMLVKTDLHLDEVYRHYRRAADEGLAGERLVEADAELLSGRARPDAPRVIGLDISKNAARYAVAIGALDDAFTEDLESTDPSTGLARELRDVELVTTTGGVGYVTERTFGRLVDAAEQPPWIAAFCLRTYNYQPIAEALAERGLSTEKATDCYPQRRFVDDVEQRWAMDQVAARGLDPMRYEADGHYYAEFYLSRPADEARRDPLSRILSA